MHKFYYSIVIFSLFILIFKAFKCALSVIADNGSPKFKSCTKLDKAGHFFSS